LGSQVFEGSNKFAKEAQFVNQSRYAALMRNPQQISLSVACIIFLVSLGLALLPKSAPHTMNSTQSFAPRILHPAPKLVRQVAGHIGGKYWWVLLAGGLVAVWLDRRVLGRLVLTLLVTQVAIEALKLAVGEVRPDGRFFDSFPSGHTTASFAYATVISLHFRWGWLWFLFACIVGLSRILTNAHWWHDVTGGAALGYLIAAGLIKWLKWDRGRGTRDKATASSKG
jgi:membrane-associated phospholipid phosphatase